jgi:hypothetical protein
MNHAVGGYPPYSVIVPIHHEQITVRERSHVLRPVQQRILSGTLVSVVPRKTQLTGNNIQRAVLFAGLFLDNRSFVITRLKKQRSDQDRESGNPKGPAVNSGRCSSRRMLIVMTATNASGAHSSPTRLNIWWIVN